MDLVGMKTAYKRTSIVYWRCIFMCGVHYFIFPEREMGLLLDQAQKEVMNGNLQAKESMKKTDTVFLQS